MTNNYLATTLRINREVPFADRAEWLGSQLHQLERFALLAHQDGDEAEQALITEAIEETECLLNSYTFEAQEAQAS